MLNPLTLSTSDADAVIQQFYPGELVRMCVKAATVHSYFVGWRRDRGDTFRGREPIWCVELFLCSILVEQPLQANSQSPFPVVLEPLLYSITTSKVVVLLILDQSQTMALSTSVTKYASL
jgi:hypothetical protein